MLATRDKDRIDLQDRMSRVKNLVANAVPIATSSNQTLFFEMENHPREQSALRHCVVVSLLFHATYDTYRMKCILNHPESRRLQNRAFQVSIGISLSLSLSLSHSFFLFRARVNFPRLSLCAR